ncbi:alpha/beta fold hydrolase BchO [Yoonia vestfoldensis]|jgi:magnesium chelatase accessory protein|uniref:2-hydroxymuconate semialdehyde hydrolase n=1 Tax=Yoonia vestfoldensis TaxID=245188 RepID=A0A1Y0EGX9_9RHOB|nr:alpha/beta fold hydrolase BchO [Yoonia vestfoldensis]ARU02887.1 2-hydroxymuconate semialdehyde hydrolase [Yoonia vestfoldensis]
MRWPPRDWPLSDHSRQILHRPHRWHVQEAGSGPLILLIHGAGGATQSFRHLFPILMQTHHVVAIDLPGQGFTQMGARQRCGLDHMAEDILSLCHAQGWDPAIILGHSAGGAIALRLWELGLRPAEIVLINAALSNFKGVAGLLFPIMAKALAATPFSASIVTVTSNRNTIRNLIRGTGSKLDDDGLALYYRLLGDRSHIDGTLSMMAQWSLDGLLARLPQISAPVHLISGLNDKTVPPSVSRDAAARLPQARLTELAQLGHLAHEENAALIAKLITEQ